MKNKMYLFLTLLLTTIFINPINSYAKELVCQYDYDVNTLKFEVKDNKVLLPFKDGEKINNKEWYYAADFNETYSKSSSSLVCPTIVVENNEIFNTVFVNSKDNCNETCTKINSTGVEDTVIGNAIGVYNSDSYFQPVFRKLSNGNIEWSINNKDFYKINKSIKLNNKDIVEIDEDFIKILFTDESKLDKIYRCVTKEGNKFKYTLSKENNNNKKDLSKNDNQGYGSTSYNGSKGAESCKDAILGSPSDPDSVAWLLQKVLNYLKVLGPMIILVMSGIDFTKAIISGDDETMQKCYKRLITRLILAVVLFFAPTLVTVILETFGFMGDPICGLQ